MSVGKIFETLNSTPPDHYFWKNHWQFTRPVFTQNSRQGTDSAEFEAYYKKLPADLKRYISRFCV
jgi:hypothetical protein